MLVVLETSSCAHLEKEKEEAEEEKSTRNCSIFWDLNLEENYSNYLDEPVFRCCCCCCCESPVFRSSFVLLNVCSSHLRLIRDGECFFFFGVPVPVPCMRQLSPVTQSAGRTHRARHAPHSASVAQCLSTPGVGRVTVLAGVTVTYMWYVWAGVLVLRHCNTHLLARVTALFCFTFCRRQCAGFAGVIVSLASGQSLPVCSYFCQCDSPH